MNTTTAQTLAAAWGDISTTPGVKECSYDHMGLWKVEYDGCTYAVGTEEEANDAAAEYIRESLWAFNPDFLANYAAGPMRAKWIKEIVGDRCEDANDDITEMVSDRIKELIDDAIAADGIGHFLNSYDGDSEDVTSPSGERLIIVRVG